jgi:hypothetical protein
MAVTGCVDLGVVGALHTNCRNNGWYRVKTTTLSNGDYLDGQVKINDCRFFEDGKKKGDQARIKDELLCAKAVWNDE